MRVVIHITGHTWKWGVRSNTIYNITIAGRQIYTYIIPINFTIYPFGPIQ